ncbi:Cullin repeat-like-containing domain protein [Scheffersomyces amazonensis]|uniref:Cullin repeat-like-containing domain protein n=1 Tax=Scheffersomyces amazonensis TaxID=1078765 RepID=UPI00315D9B7C
MSFNVDIDEADVAVLNQNLNKSKELFASISKSLGTISNKSVNASRNIKPILEDVNKLSDNKRQVERGLNILQEVSESARIINNYESILNQSIELIGLNQYVDTLNRAKSLLKNLKGKFKRFRGIINNFENTVDQSDLKLQTFYQSLIHQPASELLNSNSKLSDIKGIIALYQQQEDNVSHIYRDYCRIRSSIIIENLRSLKVASEPQERPANVQYEKGSNGIAKFVDRFIEQIKQESILSQHLEVSNDHLVTIGDKALDDLINNSLLPSMSQFFNFKNNMKVLNNDTLLLEMIENLLRLKDSLVNVIGASGVETYDYKLGTFIKGYHEIFQEYFKLIEHRLSLPTANLQNDGIIVELISKIRRITEYKYSLLTLISYYKLGDWLSTKPPFKFINVYTSVIPNLNNDSSPEYLLSSFLSDTIDAIMINIEIGLNSPSASSSASLTHGKKSAQGFTLIKYLDIVETIVNHAPSLHSSLGSQGLERLSKLKNRFLKYFLDDWNHASYIIIRDMTQITASQAHTMTGSNQGGGGGGGPNSPRPSTTSTIISTASVSKHLNNKEKEQVKEMFKNFNEAFEEALRNYEKYNITDPQLKNYLGNEIKKLIGNTYFKLYDTFGNSDFTKNKSKYIKYDKVQFERLLSEKI